jgi:SAM-dependent methyltransferase
VTGDERPAVRNHFEPDWVAPLYARGRPDVHAAVAAGLARAIGDGVPVRDAVDVGCGTGLSTAALATVAVRVVGVDPSAAMLALAPQQSGLAYVRAQGERLPFTAAAFDLATMACAFHWCDQAALAAELRRVLRPRAWLAIYHSTFHGQSPVSDDLTDWLTGAYYPDLPLPPHNPAYDPVRNPLPGFDCVGHEAVEEWVLMTLDQLVAFLLTQSSPIAAVEAGRTSVAALDLKLRTGLAPFFSAAPAVALRFGGPVFYLRPA